MNMPSRSQCDVLVVIALQEEYRQAVEITGETRVTTEVGLPIRHVMRASVNGDVGVAFALLGDMGNDASLNATTQLITALRPRLVVSLGISALISDDWKLGDVVVGTDSDNYMYRGKARSLPTEGENSSTDWEIVFGGRSLPTTHSWVKLLTGLHETDLVSWNKWVGDCVADRYAIIRDADVRQLIDLGFIRDDPFLATGPLASGPLVSASSEFKEMLKQRNRNLVALDMESAGILQAAHQHPSRPDTLVIRGISDFGDERKRELDRIGNGVLRAWSTRNALRLLDTFLLHVDFSGVPRPEPTRSVSHGHAELTEHLHRTVSKEYLEYPYTDENVDVATHARLFRNVAQVPDGSEPENVFAWIARTVWEGSRPNAVKVEGDAGTGKTALLSMLYWYQRRVWEADHSKPVPVYINLHRYNRSLKERRSVHVGEQQAVHEMRSHLQPLADLINQHPNTQLFVIVDGYDSFARHRDSLAATLLDICEPTQHRRIVGLRKLRSEADGGTRLGIADTVVILQAMSVNSPRFHDYVESFVVIARGQDPALTDRIMGAVTELGLEEVDLFTLNLLLSHGLEQRRSANSQSSEKTAKLLERFCTEHLERALPMAPRDGLLERAAAAAFHMLYNEDWLPPENDESPVFVDLANRHPRIRDFLIAKEMLGVMERISDGIPGGVDRINHVHTASVNRIAKELLRQSDSFQSQLFSAINLILLDDEAPVYARAQAAYLAGRLTYPQLIPRALNLLNRFKEPAAVLAERARDTPDEPQYLLLARTVFISLAYLGDKTTREEYIARLLSSSRWDDINRGFHLEYYEDQDYLPWEPLVSIDRLQPCPKTFNHLYNRLMADVHAKSFEIDLHTFCSLSQHRHAAGLLSEFDRIRAQEVIETALESPDLSTDELRKYVTMLRRHFGYQHFRIGHLLDDFYHIKFIKRAGWVERGLTTGESVADHMYGAYLLAMFLLPDVQPNAPDYSKDRVMRMLLIHDLAEAITDDILPQHKTDAARRKEREVFDEIGLLGTYPGMAVLRDVASLWEEFRSESTTNAKVAKEIDKLENLVQLYIYRADGMQISDYGRWAGELKAAIRTSPGRHVLEKLREFYEDPQRPPVHKSIQTPELNTPT